MAPETSPIVKSGPRGSGMILVDWNDTRPSLQRLRTGAAVMCDGQPVGTFIKDGKNAGLILSERRLAKAWQDGVLDFEIEDVEDVTPSTEIVRATPKAEVVDPAPAEVVAADPGEELVGLMRTIANFLTKPPHATRKTVTKRDENGLVVETLEEPVTN